MAIQGYEFVRFRDLRIILDKFIKSINEDDVFISSNHAVYINGQPIVVASNDDFKQYLGIQ